MKHKIRKLSLVGLLVGFALFVGLVAWQGAENLAESLKTVGWQVFWLPIFYLLPLGCAALSWHFLFDRNAGPDRKTLLYGTWVGLATNWLLPVAQVGGELVRARLLATRRFAASVAMASVVTDKTLQVVTQAFYTLAGLTLLMWRWSDRRFAIGALVGVFAIAAASFAFYRAQRAGLFQLSVRVARRILSKSADGEPPNDLDRRAIEIDAAIQAIYNRRDRLFVSALWRLAFRFAVAGEVWLALHFLDRPAGFASAIILESLGQGSRSLGFVVPAGLGVQEGAFLAVGTALGLSPQDALTLSLCKRARELAIGVPGLLALQFEAGREAVAVARGDRNETE